MSTLTERKDPEEVVAENREMLELVADGDDDSAEYASRILKEYGGGNAE